MDLISPFLDMLNTTSFWAKTWDLTVQAHDYLALRDHFALHQVTHMPLKIQYYLQL